MEKLICTGSVGEIYMAQPKVAAQYLKNNKPKTLKMAINQLRSGEDCWCYDLNQIIEGHLKLRKELSEQLKLKNELLEFFEFFIENSKFIEDTHYWVPLSEIFFYKVFWVRDYQSWKPKSYNNQRQFASLLRHLFAKYDVPSFMDEAWMPPIKKPKFQEWFIHIGSGENIRTAHQLPCPLTKKEAHYFLQAPDNCAIRDAFRYGQIMSLGGDMRVFRAFMGTKVASSYENNEFVLSLLRFFIANPMLDTAQYGPIVDYIWNQKYNSERTVQRDTGAIEIKPPSQPNFSMTGRSVDALLKHVEEWHKKLGKEQKSGNNTWLHSKVKDYEYIEGKEGTKSFKIWKIYELLSSSELVKEGREMSHCVSSYASSCMHGRSSIFTMIMESYAGKEKCVTIEVTGGRIIQIRGKRNRVPTVQENSVLSRWAQVEGLSRSQYLR